jgi:hypothetical protein
MFLYELINTLLLAGLIQTVNMLLALFYSLKEAGGFVFMLAKHKEKPISKNLNKLVFSKRLNE